MSLSSVKSEILAAMLLLGKPERATKIAEEVGREFPSVMMHIIGLSRMGYAVSPEKGLYTLTEKAREVLGMPKINREIAKKLLAYMPQDEAFHFYAGLDRPLNLQAHGLRDFCDKILTVNSDSITFHMNRGDFESWFSAIGDVELAKKVALLKKKKLSGEELQARLASIVGNHCVTLSKEFEDGSFPE
jgi:hypothetical protein